VGPGTFELLGDLPAKAQIERGDLKFRLHGHKLKGEFAIVLMKGRGKGNEWLLLKKKDEFADPEWDAEAHNRSVLTGRTQEEIARNMPAVETASGSKRTFPKERFAPDAGQHHSDERRVGHFTTRGNGWLYEIKWDGVRAISFLENGALRMLTAAENPANGSIPS